MSTYLYLVCGDHNPPLHSVDEVSQHAHRKREIANVVTWIADRERLVEEYKNGLHRPPRDYTSPEAFDRYFLNHAMRFLSQHPQCSIGLIDENGRTWNATTGELES